MSLFTSKRLSKSTQYALSIALVAGVAAGCYTFSALVGYRVVALILLMTVSVLAMLFDILPVLVAAALSALIWNFFFIPPLFTFHIDNTEDVLMFLLYFVIALINAALTIKIRDAEKKARDKEEKENSIRLYNTLLNSLSHELRTPIAAIIGSVDTLKENAQNLSQQNQTELLRQIETAGTRLNRQVENLLNMSRLETGMLQLNKDWCDINELIFSVLQKLSPVAAKHPIRFQPDETLPLFRLDAGLMEQVLHNILHNALLHTPDNTVITIRAADQNESCVITISDTGKGFPESGIGLVFGKFYRLPDSKTGGTGLGLSIAKGFVEAHGGKIVLENNATGGAKFTIELPAETSFIANLNNG